MRKKKGALLVNLGTPKDARVGSIRRYLREFLSDKRVIDISWLGRFLLVYGLIAPFRAPRVKKEYDKIYDANKGMPLNYHSEALLKKLSKVLPHWELRIAMRYPLASLRKGLVSLLDSNVERIVVVPLFPQYASSTSGSVAESVMRLARRRLTIPHLRFVQSFWQHPGFIHAVSEQVNPYLTEQTYDRYIFSYHGLPERHLRKAHGSVCTFDNCCETNSSSNAYCYRANCFGTTKAVAQVLGLPEEQCVTCFQSRLGRAPWIRPYTDEVVKQLPQEGVTRVLFLSPSFVCDCLETTIEIGETYANAFKRAGGQVADVVPCLNDSTGWVKGLAEMVEDAT